LHLQGYGRNEVAKKSRESRATVTREIDRFEEQIEESGIRKAAEEYGVSQLIENLIEIAQIRKANSLDISDFVEGAKIAKTFRETKIDAAEASRLISEIWQRTESRGYTVNTIVDDCAELNHLESEYGRFDNLKAEYDRIGSTMTQLQQEVATLKEHRDTEKTALHNTLKENNTTREEIVRFTKTSEALSTHGLDLDTLDKAVNILTAFEKEDYSPKRIVNRLKTIESLEDHLKTITSEAERTQTQLDKSSEQLHETESELREKAGALKEANKIEELGFSIPALQKIRNTIVSIASTHGLNRSQATTKFEQDLTKHYDTLLGLQSEVTSLEEKTKQLTHQINDLEERNRSRASEIAAYTRLRKKGVDDQTIIRWNNIMKQAGLNATIVEEELKTQTNLKTLEDKTKQRISELERRESALIETIKELKSTQAAIKTAIETVQRSGVKLIETTVEETRKKADEAIEEMTHAITENTRETVATIEKTKGDIADITAGAEKSAKDAYKELVQVQKRISILAESAIKAGEEIGRLHPISEAYEFLNTGQGEPAVVLPASIRFLTNLENWLESNKRFMFTLKQDIRNVINALTVQER
jgi:predicted  nucleic acid-binding Zn-ribbon protein